MLWDSWFHTLIVFCVFLSIDIRWTLEYHILKVPPSISSHWSSGSILALIDLFKSSRWPSPRLACVPMTILLIFNESNYLVARMLVGLSVIEVWVIDRMPLTVIKSVFTEATYWAHASAQMNPFLRWTIFTIVAFLFFGGLRHEWTIAMEKQHPVLQTFSFDKPRLKLYNMIEVIYSTVRLRATSLLN